MSYEWKTRSSKSLTDVTGWNTNILTLYNVSMADNDDYRCVATNASGSNPSYYATLLVEGTCAMTTVIIALHTYMFFILCVYFLVFMWLW